MKRKTLTPRQQIAEVCRIINLDANGIEYLYYTANGTMCAIGGLAHYGAGVAKWRLGRVSSNGLDSDEAWEKVVKRFPVLAALSAEEVYGENDVHTPLCSCGGNDKNCEDVAAHAIATTSRRKALCALFRGLLTQKQT